MFSGAWTGFEQADQFQPVLMDGSSVQSGGLEEIYALSLIGLHRPESGRKPILARGDEIYTHPLTNDEWRIAFELFRERVLPDRVAGTARLKASINSLLTRLIKGELKAFSRSTRGVGPLKPIAAESWTVDVVLDRFLFGLIHEDILDGSVLRVAPTKIKTSRLDESEWPEFVFVEMGRAEPKPSLHRPKTTVEANQREMLAGEIFAQMQSEQGDVKRREFQLRCQIDGISSTISRAVFSTLNKSTPGPRSQK